MYEIISKMFFSRLLFLREVFLDLDKYIFLWHTYFLGVSSEIRVTLHVGKYGIHSEVNTHC
jgi:hypothetical protein